MENLQTALCAPTVATTHLKAASASLHQYEIAQFIAWKCSVMETWPAWLLGRQGLLMTQNIIQFLWHMLTKDSGQVTGILYVWVQFTDIIITWPSPIVGTYW